MSHVDEGLIHAHLDGAFPPGSAQGEEIEAHLAVCVDCRVLLEKAREVKERAQLVMNRLSPTGIAPPPFEEILARRARAAGEVGGRAAPGGAAATGGTAVDTDDVSAARARRRRMLPPLPLAWAATLILALGAGWMVRAYLGPAQFEAADQAAALGADAGEQAELESATRDEARLRFPPATPTEPGAAESSARAPEPAAAELRDAAREERVANAAAPPPVASQKAAGAQADLPPPPVVAPPEAPALLRRSSAAFAPAGEAAGSDGALPAAQLLAAYGRATAEETWQDEPIAGTLPLLGYREIARLEGGDVVRAERATVDRTELLRVVYSVEGDTVELVQRIEAVPVALDELVVTGITADTTAAASRQSRSIVTRARADSVARARSAAAAAGAAAAASADVRLEQNESGRIIESLQVDADSLPALRGRNLVLIAEGGRHAILLATLDEARLQQLALGVRR